MYEYMEAKANAEGLLDAFRREWCRIPDMVGPIAYRCSNCAFCDNGKCLLNRFSEQYDPEQYASEYADNPTIAPGA